MPRSRTEDTGETADDDDEPTVNVAVGSRFWRRLVVHDISSSVFPGLSWSRLDCIQSATSLTHPDIVDERSSTCDGYVCARTYHWSKVVEASWSVYILSTTMRPRGRVATRPFGHKTMRQWSRLRPRSLSSRPVCCVVYAAANVSMTTTTSRCQSQQAVIAFNTSVRRTSMVFTRAAPC